MALESGGVMAYKFRGSDLIVFDGQSLNIVPTVPLSFPTKVMATGITGTTSTNAGITATTWLERQGDVTQRVDRFLLSCSGTKTLIDTAGTRNINQSMTAADIFAEASDYWQARRDAGFDQIIALTVSPTTDFGTAPSAKLTILSAYNDLLRAAVGTELDGLTDLDDLIPQLNNPNDATYYSDGTHYTDAATTLIAPEVRTTYLAVLAG